MEGNSGRNQYRGMLILSVVVNLILAAFTGFSLVESNRLKAQVDDLSYSYTSSSSHPGTWSSSST